MMIEKPGGNLVANYTKGNKTVNEPSVTVLCAHTSLAKNYSVSN